MPVRSSNDIDISSSALLLVGASGITSFTDGTTESDLASRLYEDTATSVFSATTWRFATTQHRLNRLTAPPLGRWDVAWELPTDCLTVRAVSLNDHPIAFERYDNHIYTKRISDTMEPTLDYVRRVPTEQWPAYFVKAVIHALAAEFAMPLRENAGLAGLYEQRFDRSLAHAKSIDAQGRTNSVMNTKRFIRRRSG